MKKLLLILGFLIVSIHPDSNSQGWVKIFGTDYNENDPYEIYQLAVNSKGEIFLIAEYLNQDKSSYLFFSNDEGKSWQSKNLKIPEDDYNFSFYNFYYYTKIRINSKDYIFIALDSTIIRSTDNGITFETILNDSIMIELFRHRNYHYNKIYYDIAPNDDIYISCIWVDSTKFLNGYHTIKSTNNGENWMIVAKNSINFFKLSFDNVGNVFTAMDFDASKSSDTCKTWESLNVDTIHNGTSIGWAIDCDVDKFGNLFVLDEVCNVFKSTDQGNSWTIFDLQNPTWYPNSIEIADNGWIFTSTARSLDNGVSWYDKQRNFNFLKATDSSCYGIYMKRTIWKFSNEPINVENQFEDFQVIIAPNPASEYIEIKVGGKLSESLKIRIYNIYGEQLFEQVTRLNQDYLPLRIDVSGFPNGIYFIRIAENIQKFVVLR